jgi:hypothetical protein
MLDRHVRDRRTKGQQSKARLDPPTRDQFMHALDVCLQMAHAVSAEAAGMPRAGPELTAHLMHLATLDDRMSLAVEGITGARIYVPQ